MKSSGMIRGKIADHKSAPKDEGSIPPRYVKNIKKSRNITTSYWNVWLGDSYTGPAL